MRVYDYATVRQFEFWVIEQFDIMFTAPRLPTFASLAQIWKCVGTAFVPNTCCIDYGISLKNEKATETASYSGRVYICMSLSQLLPPFVLVRFLPT